MRVGTVAYGNLLFGSAWKPVLKPDSARHIYMEVLVPGHHLVKAPRSLVDGVLEVAPVVTDAPSMPSRGTARCLYLSLNREKGKGTT